MVGCGIPTGRKWATERKRLSLKDAKAGGLKDTETLLTCYQQCIYYPNTLPLTPRFPQTQPEFQTPATPFHDEKTRATSSVHQTQVHEFPDAERDVVRFSNSYPNASEKIGPTV